MAKNLLLPLSLLAVGVFALGGRRAKAQPSEQKPEGFEFPDLPSWSDVDWPDPDPDPDPVTGDEWIPPGVGKPLHAMVAGDPQDPDIASLLAQMDDYLASEGVNMDYVSAKEITTMPKGKNQPSGNKPVAIPVFGLWPNIVPTLLLWQEHLREPMGIPMSLRGYRPVDYNKAVGGEGRAQHQWFSGFDIYLAGAGNTSKNRQLLGLLGAEIYLSAPASQKVGFGAYSAPTPSNIHLDTGFKHRTWREAQYYINKAKAG